MTDQVLVDFQIKVVTLARSKRFQDRIGVGDL